ncbi:hypothetical protein [Embleya sp. NPDC059237]|uniref:hypothetical protein n=1 Tax=Embleya sp. NPDC059237 TaxID=3346784 RepID=UPI0036C17434
MGNTYGNTVGNPPPGSPVSKSPPVRGCRAGHRSPASARSTRTTARSVAAAREPSYSYILIDVDQAHAHLTVAAAQLAAAHCLVLGTADDPAGRTALLPALATVAEALTALLLDTTGGTRPAD